MLAEPLKERKASRKRPRLIANSSARRFPMRFIIAFALPLLLITSTASDAQQRRSEPPNVVLIMTDDAGYADIGSYGAPDVRTPNIDSLARDGVKLTDFYANAMSCTPTRAGLIAGRYQQRYGIEFPLAAPGLPGSDGGLPPLAHSLPLLLKKNGYVTALVGKWHLGYRPEFSPRAHGFDLFFGSKSAAIDYYTHHTTRPSEGAQFLSAQPDLWENDALVERAGYMTDLITRKAVEFINQNAARPFFIDVAFNAPHSPTQPPDLSETTLAPPGATRADYAAVMERVDRGVGDILQALRARRLEHNTIVIFTNDNGGIGLSHSAPLFHRKFSAWEGGIRVPALIRWPARIPAGTVSGQVGITMDLTTSILAATATPVPSDARLEGIDLFPILERRAPEVERALFWRTAGPSPVNMNQKAVRDGDWKLIVDGAVTRIFLFNVKADPGERVDWFARRQDIVRRLQQLLTDWERDVDLEATAFVARGQ
jgi:arylsulfatase A-like enzyme